MPRLLSYTPAWLTRPSPGYNLFAPKVPTQLSSRPAKPQNDPPSLRILAHRGTEVFVVVDNELRWSDLVYLKDISENDTNENALYRHSTDSAEDHDQIASKHYKILKAPIYHDIKQLIVSPYGEYLTILTAHTVHVALIPDSSHLSNFDRESIRLKTFQVGPTSHVVDQPAVVTALWHPCGINGNCLVTITVDAVVRLWEFDRNNRWSFNSPTLAIDLKKLANGSSIRQDFSPSKFGSSQGFSPDCFQMEVASACFGSRSSTQGSEWAAMTLWVAMREGDIYALCPLVPNHFQVPDNFVSDLQSRLSTSEQLATSPSTEITDYTKSYRSQSAWLADLCDQLDRPGKNMLQLSNGQYSNIYDRPTHPTPIPKLQGPFHVISSGDELFDINDIHVMTASDVLPTKDTRLDEESFIFAGLPISVLCTATVDGLVRLHLLSKEVEAEWLPSQEGIGTPSRTRTQDQSLDLLLLESLETSNSSESSWPLFTPDEHYPHALFVTHTQGVLWISLKSWADKLIEEMASYETSGGDFRLEVLLGSGLCVVENAINFHHLRGGTHVTRERNFSGCVNILDSDLGNLILAFAEGRVEATRIGDRETDTTPNMGALHDSWDEDVMSGNQIESRPKYTPPVELWYESTLTSFMEEHMKSVDRKTRQGEVKLSSQNLKLVMEAHRILSHETHLLGAAAADLFRRCERLQEEFEEQIRRVDQVAKRIDSVLDDELDNDDGLQEEEPVGINVEYRLDQAKSKGEELARRYSELRKRVSSFSGRALSEREMAWNAEMDSMDNLLNPGIPNGAVSGHEGSKERTNVGVRYEQLLSLKDEMTASALQYTDSRSGHEIEGSGVSHNQRKARWAEISAMLDREGALIDATTTKLNQLHSHCSSG